jgi:NAD(P)-dependent dehydrogenase (short-subunit alcohol dehydrogenase family)
MRASTSGALQGRRVVVIGGPDGSVESLIEAARREGAHVARAGSDARDEAAIEASLDAAIEELGGLDALVTAFVPRGDPRPAPFAATTLASFRARLSDGLSLPFIALRRALDEMIASGTGGRIVIVLSRGSGGAAEEAAISGLSSFVGCVAREYGHRAIACNAVVVSAPARHAADATLFLLSPEASFVNGEIVHVQGASGPA